MPTLLIVEDNPLIRELLRQQLEEQYTLLEAENGRVGVEVATRALPDLILMDLTMPVMTGWDAIRELRRDGTTCRIPVIALTAMSNATEIERALSVGADTVLQKPFDDDVLHAEIQQLLSLAGSVGRISRVRRRAPDDGVARSVDKVEPQS